MKSKVKKSEALSSFSKDFLKKIAILSSQAVRTKNIGAEYLDEVNIN